MAEHESADNCHINSSEEDIIKEINDVLTRHRKQDFSNNIAKLLTSKDSSLYSSQVVAFDFPSFFHCM